MYFFDIEHVAALSREALKARGLSIRIERNWSVARALMEQLDHERIAPILDPDKHAFTWSSCFWMFAMDSNDNPKIGGGVRLDDIAGQSVKGFLDDALRPIFGSAPHTSNIDLGDWGSRIAYFGDLRVKKRDGLSKSARDDVRFFTMYGHFRVFQDMQADCCYCFLRERDAMRGAGSAYGFLNSSPFPWHWDNPPFEAGNPEWIAWTRRDELERLALSVQRTLDRNAEDQESLAGVGHVDAKPGPDEIQE